MIQCLMCSATFQGSNRFIDILLLKNTHSQVCEDCFQKFEKISDNHCPTCYKEATKDCLDCRYWQNQGKEVEHKSLFIYNQVMKEYFSRYKFQGDYILRKVFSKVIRKELKKYKDYAIVPIPVSEKKIQKRGFNQVEGLLEAAGISYRTLLNKKETEAQSSKNREERLKSRGNFSIQKEKNIPEKILLVDDIYTTGSTLQDAKQTLIENGVKEIMTFSLAR